MKRILHMTPPEIKNGVYRYIFNHMPYVDQNEYQFCFLTKSAEELKSTPEYALYKFPVYKLNNVQRDGKAAFVKEINSILDEGFDAVHLHTSLWRGFLIEEIAMQRAIIRVIVHSHSSGADFTDSKERNKLVEEHEAFKQQFDMNYATDVCACSWMAADWLFSEKIPRNIIKILPNAIKVDDYKYDDDKRTRIRNLLNLQGKTVVGNVGRYCYQKNQEFLIEVFYKAHLINNDLFLILVGQGDSIEKIRQRIIELDLENDIYCFEWREDICDLLLAMDIFCLPSRFEGLPISLVEAQVSGLRCLVSDNVTKEVNILGNLEYLPLNEDLWVNAIVEGVTKYGREDKSRIISEAGFDIKTSWKKLVQLYG